MTIGLFTVLGLLVGVIIGWRLGRQSHLIDQLIAELRSARSEATLYGEVIDAQAPSPPQQPDER